MQPNDRPPRRANPGRRPGQGGGARELPDRDELPGYVVNRTARLFARALNRRLTQLGLTVGQWPVLLALLEQDGLTQAELSRRLDIEQPTAANTLKRMARDGVIRRSPHATDRRQEHVHLTQRARSLVHNLAAIAAEVNGQALHGMSRSEARIFMQMLHRVIENLNADETIHQARRRNDRQDTPPVNSTPGARRAGPAGAETNIRP